MIEINGIKYVKRELPTPRTPSKSFLALLPTYMLYNIPGRMFNYRQHNKKDRDFDGDLIGEFTLIQQKKSKLSSNERKFVVMEFNEHFKQVEDDQK